MSLISKTAGLTGCFLLLLASCANPKVADDAPKSDPGVSPLGQQLIQFERSLADLRRDHQIPGMSAALVISNRLVWSKGFGFSELKSKIPAHPETLYHVSSLTKLFATTVTLQLVEEGKLDLDRPLSTFGVRSRSGETDRVTVRHLLTHTSESSPPGHRFRYNGTRFGELDKVLQFVTRRPFATLVTEKILDPLDLQSTAPNPENLEACSLSRRDPRRILIAVALGYESTGKKPVPYPGYFGTSAGLVSSVLDIAKFSVAYNGDLLLKPETKRMAETPVVLTNTIPERRFPCGLGWYIQELEGQKVLWHHGQWLGSSALLIQIPSHGISFVLMANSDRLSNGFGLGEDENVLRSPFARSFIERFKPTQGGNLPSATKR